MNTVEQKQTPSQKVSRAASRRHRHGARQFLRTRTGLSRMKNCGSALCKRKGDGQYVTVKMSDGRAGFGGLQSCGSTWSCPVCSFQIAAVRSSEVSKAVEAWHKSGGRVLFVTLTMRHTRSQPLDMLWDNLSHAWGRVTSGRAWKDEQKEHGSRMTRWVKSGVHAGEEVQEMRIPYVRAVEVTHGDKNGWHVHIHALLFLAADACEESSTLLGEQIYGRWANALVSRGMTSPSPQHGIDIKLVDRGDGTALAKYFTKTVFKAKSAGFEVAGGATKKARGENRTPFQILEDLVESESPADMALWWAWEQASKGRRQLTWSVGLRDLVGLNEEKTDKELTEEDELKGDVVMRFDKAQWKKLHVYSAQVLDYVEAGTTYEEICRVYDLPAWSHEEAPPQDDSEDED